MRSTMPFYGVPAPGVRAIARARLDPIEFPRFAGWTDAVLELWRGARRREERYLAIALCRTPGARRYQTPRALPLYEEMIVTGAWWDYVDEIAIRLVGGILRSHPGSVAPRMRAWSRSSDLWKRRTAIICQVGSKEATDLELLQDCIEPARDSREFFLRKAIGWALRQYAWTDPDWVRRYLRREGDRLSPLSRREAAKHLGLPA